MNKYIAIGGVAILAAIAVIFLLFVNQPDTVSVNSGQMNESEPVQQKEFVKTDLAPDKTPERFPSSIPIEEGAKITQNYNATAPDGRFQATRVFETSLTLAQNFALYKDFLTRDGWKTEATLDLENYKMVLGSKGNAQLQISIDNNATIGMKTVNISYTEQPSNPQ